MIHLTLCGPYAGTPLCTVKKTVAKDNGDEFYHAMYWKDWHNPNLCPVCKAEWEAAEPDEDENTNA